MTTLPSADAPAEQANVAPMGPIVDAGFTRFVLRPFKSATTYRNLKATGVGVFHVTDDALLIAKAAVGKVRCGADVACRPAGTVAGVVLTGACRYYELKVVDLDDREDRTTIVADVVGSGTLRDFFGFNRARHAVLEAAILATRTHLTGTRPVLDEYARLAVIVEKTGGPGEREAMRFLTGYVEGWKPG